MQTKPAEQDKQAKPVEPQSFHDFRDYGNPMEKSYQPNQTEDLDTFGRRMRSGS